MGFDERMDSSLVEAVSNPRSRYLLLLKVTNNWWPAEVLGEPLYEEGTNADDLYAASLQALYEFNPLEADTILYRSQRFGKHLEIFFPDYRSYRDPNPENDEPDLADMMGEEQLEWLKQGLKDSTATWKIISSHDPLGVVTGGAGDRDSFGQVRTVAGTSIHKRCDGFARP